MKKTFCDHCGKEIKSNNLHFVTGSNLQVVLANDCRQFASLIKGDFDLCEDCKDLLANQISDFLNSSRVETSESEVIKK